MKKTNRKDAMQTPAIAGKMTIVGSRQTDFPARNLQPANSNSATVGSIPEKAPTSATPNENKRLSETEIIRRAQDGDEAMFEYLAPVTLPTCVRGLPAFSKRPERSRRFEAGSLFALG